MKLSDDSKLQEFASLQAVAAQRKIGKGYFAERGMRNAESCQRVICGKFNADFFLRNEG